MTVPNLEELDLENESNEEVENPESPNPQSPTESPATLSQVDREELETLRKMNLTLLQRESQLSDQLNSLQAQRSTPTPEPEIPLPSKEDDPIGYLEALHARQIKALEKRLEDSVRPMQEVATATRHQQDYAAAAQKLMAKYPKLDAQFFTELYPQLGGPTFDVRQLEVAAMAAFGFRNITGVPDPNANSSTPPNDPPVTTPPRTPSNSSPSPTSAPKKLTEGQRRAMESMKLKPTDPKDVEKFMSYISQDTRLIDMGY